MQSSKGIFTQGPCGPTLCKALAEALLLWILLEAVTRDTERCSKCLRPVNTDQGSASASTKGARDSCFWPALGLLPHLLAPDTVFRHAAWPWQSLAAVVSHSPSVGACSSAGQRLEHMDATARLPTQIGSPDLPLGEEHG